MKLGRTDPGLEWKEVFVRGSLTYSKTKPEPQEVSRKSPLFYHRKLRAKMHQLKNSWGLLQFATAPYIAITYQHKWVLTRNEAGNKQKTPPPLRHQNNSPPAQGRPVRRSRSFIAAPMAMGSERKNLETTAFVHVSKLTNLPNRDF